MCEITGCSDKDSLFMVSCYGPSRTMRDYMLCRFHMRELWNKIRPLLAVGLAGWSQDNLMDHGDDDARVMRDVLVHAKSVVAELVYPDRVIWWRRLWRWIRG